MLRMQLAGYTRSRRTGSRLSRRTWGAVSVAAAWAMRSLRGHDGGESHGRPVKWISTVRKLSLGQPWPRQRHPGRARDRGGRQVSRDAIGLDRGGGRVYDAAGRHRHDSKSDHLHDRRLPIRRCMAAGGSRSRLRRASATMRSRTPGDRLCGRWLVDRGRRATPRSARAAQTHFTPMSVFRSARRPARCSRRRLRRDARESARRGRLDALRAAVPHRAGGQVAWATALPPRSRTPARGSRSRPDRAGSGS